MGERRANFQTYTCGLASVTANHQRLHGECCVYRVFQARGYKAIMFWKESETLQKLKITRLEKEII